MNEKRLLRVGIRPWATFLKAHWGAIAAMKFFKVEVLSLRGPVRFGALSVALACAGPPPGELAPCPPAPDAALVDSLGATVRVDAGDPERGEAVFGRMCARCHAPEAAARESRLFRSYPRLDCAPYVSQTSPGYLYTAIAEGGAAIRKRDLMKPFAEELTDGEIADLVEYIQRGGGQ